MRCGAMCAGVIFRIIGEKCEVRSVKFEGNKPDDIKVEIYIVSYASLKMQGTAYSYAFSNHIFSLRNLF